MSIITILPIKALNIYWFTYRLHWLFGLEKLGRPHSNRPVFHQWTFFFFLSLTYLSYILVKMCTLVGFKTVEFELPANRCSFIGNWFTNIFLPILALWVTDTHWKSINLCPIMFGLSLIIFISVIIFFHIRNFVYNTNLQHKRIWFIALPFSFLIDQNMTVLKVSTPHLPLLKVNSNKIPMKSSWRAGSKTATNSF